MTIRMKARQRADHVQSGRPSRRAVLVGVVSSLLILPFARILRIDRSSFVERGGWILKRSDVE